MKTLLCALLLAALAMTAAAADVTGRWSGTFTVAGSDGQPNDMPTLVILKQTGTQITGSGGPDENRQIPIQNGKIEGNKITGQAVDPDGPIYKLALTVTGDRIQGDVEVTGSSGQVQKGKLDVARIK